MLFLCSCGSRHHAAPKEISLTALPHDKPQAFFLAMKEVDGKKTDSIYDVVFNGLLDSNRIALLAEHLLYYDKLKGKRKAAAALLAQGRGWVANYHGYYDSSLRLFCDAAKMYREIKDTSGLARSYFGIGVNNMYQGNYQEAFKYDLDAIRLFESLKDSSNTYEVKLELVNGFSFQNDLEKAADLLQTCLDYYTRKQQWDAVAYCQSMFSKVYTRKGDPASAIQYSEAALAIRERLKDTGGISASLNNIAVGYVKLKQWEKALEGLERSLTLVRLQNDKRQEIIVQINIANCLAGMKRYKEAEALLLELAGAAKERGQKSSLVNSYRTLARINKEQGRFPAALSYYEQYKGYSDSLFNEEKSKTINELLIKYETATKEVRIAQLTNERELDKTRKWLYLSLSLLLLVSLISVIIVWLHKHKANKMKLGKVTQELESNTEALRSFTERIIRKNKQIEELEQQLRANRQIADDAEVEEQNDERLSQLYQLKILTEEDWQNFKILFDKVYPGFINKLRHQFPEIPPSEERQTLLIKLNINNKECAAMLGISVDSVKKSRYRLKKRFQLREEASLDEFVRSL